MRTVSALTASDVPVMGSANARAVPSFQSICTLEANVPLPDGWNATRNVHESPAFTVGVPDPQAFAPVARSSLNAGLDVAVKPIALTRCAAAPVLRIVTSSGAGVLLVVTLPKS